SLYGKLPYLSRSIAIDSNEQTLRGVLADQGILVGNGMARPGSTQSAEYLANNSKSLIARAVADLDLVFIIADMGDTAGTGISLTVAEVLKEKQITTIGVAITPVPYQNEKYWEIALSETSVLGQLTGAAFPIYYPSMLHSNSRKELLSPARNLVASSFMQIYRAA
ncbi:hypothetical protein JZU71_00340, partial [bacterium]|nr:hypothetical protein [bacterium]